MADNSDSECDIELLNALLENEDDDAPDESNLEINNSKKDVEFDFLSNESNVEDSCKPKANEDILKETERHSSDDEDEDYYKKRDYSDYGRDIKNLLKRNEPEKKEHNPAQSFSFSKAKTLSTNIIKKPIPSNTSTPAKPKTPINTPSTNVYSDPVFGYAINKPLISSTELVQLMEGRKAVKISVVKEFLSHGKPSEDWVVAGVITYKSPSKKTAKGDSYAIWKLSDMTMTMNTITVFMFSSAFQSLWKVMEGSVLAILNANVMESRDSDNLATIGVDNPAKVMILGTSRDMGTCKSRKKNGDKCSNVVNVRLCEYCVYHVKQEYSKHSKRSDLQSSFNGKGITMSGPKKNSHQNKMKDSFMNSEQSYKPVPSRKSSAMISKDKERLEQLKSNASVSKSLAQQIADNTKPKAKMVELSKNQMKKDYHRLNKLKNVIETPIEKIEEKLKLSVKTPPLAPTAVMSEGKTALSIAIAAPKTATRFNFKNIISSPTTTSSSPAPKTSSQSPLMAPKTPKEFDLNDLCKSPTVPKLGTGSINGIIDLSSPAPKRNIDMSKIRALEWVRKNGKIKPSNPNKILESKEMQAKQGLKRKRDEEKEVKKVDKETFAQKFRKMTEIKSSHTDLITKAEEEEKEKYFNKMEIKERMEEKMLTTFQVPCKAVRCTLCKYTAFSASDMCKENRHPIKVFDAVKRFYKCGDCGNRTVTLDRIPTISCTKCNSSSWIKSTMMDEKKTQIKTAQLSLRGDEEKYYGNINSANLNLIVPE